MQGDKFHSWTLDKLTPEMITKAKEELGETAEVRSEALIELKQLIEEEADFYPMMDEMFLLRFLRARKFDVPRAFRTLRNYYKYKADYSRLVTDFLPSEVRHILDMNCGAALPYRDQHGSVIVAFKTGQFDLDKGTRDELLACLMLALDMLLRSEVTQVCGAVLVCDMEGFNFRYARLASNPMFVYRCIRSVQDCLPLRLKAIHCLNVNRTCQLIYDAVRPILPEKLKKRIHLHGKKFENFHTFLPPEILPSDFGGHLGSMDGSEPYDALLNLEAHYLEQNRYGYHRDR